MGPGNQKIKTCAAVGKHPMVETNASVNLLESQEEYSFSTVGLGNKQSVTK